MLLGFASGLPLALSGSTLAVWLTEADIDLATIGLFSLVGLPYTIKFLWAPLVDALDIPLLSRRFGRRRGWLIFSQLLLIAAIVLLGLTRSCGIDLAHHLGAVTVATASATQDIVIDAFRVESLETSEQAAGMAGYVAAYRVGMLVAGAGVLALVAWFEYRGIPHGLAWTWGYVVAALADGRRPCRNAFGARTGRHRAAAGEGRTRGRQPCIRHRLWRFRAISSPGRPPSRSCCSCCCSNSATPLPAC